MTDSKRLAPQVPAGVMGELQSEVSVEAAPLLQFIMRHVGVVVGVVLLLIASIVAAGIYQWHAGKTQHEAQLTMGKVLTGAAGANKVKALEALAKDLPVDMQPGLWLEVATASQETQDFTKAAAAFARVAELDKGPLGVVSVLNQSDMLLKAGSPAQALSVLEPLVDKAPEPMRPTVREAVAVAAEAAGDTTKAIAAYQSMLSSSQSQDVAYYKARIAALEKK